MMEVAGPRPLVLQPLFGLMMLGFAPWPVKLALATVAWLGG